MRHLPVPASEYYAEIASTSIFDRYTADAWRGGIPVASDLAIAGLTITWDASRKVQGQLTTTITDRDGSLAIDTLSAPLAPGGSRLHLAHQFGATTSTVDLGAWRIRKASRDGALHPIVRSGRVVWVHGEGTVTVEADDEAATVDLHRLDYSERTSTKSTVLQEIAHLLRDDLAVVALGVTDGPIEAGITYDEGRLDAVTHLLDRINATYRVNGTTLEVVPATGIPTDWVITWGDGGTLVSYANTNSDDGLANASISQNTLDDKSVITGRAYVASGPLQYGGPFGKVPAFHSAIATTEDGVVQDAVTHLATVSDRGDVELTVECLTNPALQLHDIITLTTPSATVETPLRARVTAMALTVDVTEHGTVPAKTMRLTVAVPHAHLEAISLDPGQPSTPTPPLVIQPGGAITQPPEIGPGLPAGSIVTSVNTIQPVGGDVTTTRYLTRQDYQAIANPDPRVLYIIEG